MSGILDRIDDTLAGYEGAVLRDGGDAMRWSPQRVICDDGGPLMPVRWSVLRHGTYYFNVTAMAMASSLAMAMERLGAALAAAAVPLAMFAHELFHTSQARCPACNPHGNPGKLCIDGREYRRRQKARQRKKRRR